MNPLIKHPYYLRWLSRLRKNLRQSGRLRELSLHLALETKRSSAEWEKQLGLLMEEECVADPDLIASIDHWIQKRSINSPDSDKPGQQLDLI